MKKTLSTILATATVLTSLLGSTALAADQTIDGYKDKKTTGEVQVNGIIGEFDNTTDGPDPEDVNDWINVTIPTTALFYTTEASNHSTITSPTYNVTNNSARGVNTKVAGVNTVSKMDQVTLLKVNDVELFKDGAATVVETDLFDIAKADTSSGSNTSVKTFGFSGTATPADKTKEVNPSFKLVLKFAPIID